MPRRKQEFIQGYHYHLFNRGVDHHPIFLDDADYHHCLHLIQRHQATCSVSVIAYCLMPNHYHLFVHQESELPLSHFIGNIFNAYVQHFNRRAKRRGPLFEGRFKHVLVDQDEYARHLCRYIHLNPVAAGLVARPLDWPYSNYRDWMRVRNGTLKNDDFIAARWPSPEHYLAFLNGAVSYPANFRPLE